MTVTEVEGTDCSYYSFKVEHVGSILTGTPLHRVQMLCADELSVD